MSSASRPAERPSSWPGRRIANKLPPAQPIVNNLRGSKTDRPVFDALRNRPLSPLEAARSGTPFLTPFLEPGLHRYLFSILLTAEDWLLDLQPKPNPKRIENTLSTSGRDTFILVPLVP